MLLSAIMGFGPDGIALGSLSAMPPILTIWFAIGTSALPTSRCGLSIRHISGVLPTSSPHGKQQCASRLLIAVMNRSATLQCGRELTI